MVFTSHCLVSVLFEDFVSDSQLYDVGISLKDFRGILRLSVNDSPLR